MSTRAAASIVALAVVVWLLPLVAHAAPAAFVGTWKLAAVSTSAGAVAKEKLGAGTMVWTFRADGTLDITVNTDGKSATAKATWTLAGTTITIDESGQKNQVTFKRTGAQLHIDAVTTSVKMTFDPVH